MINVIFNALSINNLMFAIVCRRQFYRAGECGLHVDP